MVGRVVRVLGGYAVSRRDLRLLYVAMFLSFLGTSIVFPLRLLYAQAHGATPAQLGLMAASFLLAPLLAQVPLGGLVDRWGRVPVLVSGLIAHAVISLLYIIFNTPPELIALRFAEGISIAAVRPAVNAYVADVVPEEHRSEAYGGLTATLNAGLLIGPLLGGLVGQYLGFTAAYLLNVAVEVVAVILIWGRVGEPAVHGKAPGHEDVAGVSWRRLVTAPLVGVYVAFCCAQIVMGFLASLWSIWVHDLGGSYTYIGATYTVFALPQIFFGATAGRLGERWGRARLLLGAGVAVSLIYVSYGFVTDLTLIMVLGIVEGLFLVFQQPLAQGLLADASPPEARGRAQGLAGAAGAIGGASAAFASLPLYHDARPLPFVLAGAIMVVGSVVAATGAAIFARQRRIANADRGTEMTAGAAAR